MAIEIIEVRPSWTDMCHVEFRLDGASWRDGSVPAEVAADRDGLVAWLEARSELYLVDMGIGNAQKVQARD